MADPTYLDADTGVITEGDPWVCVNSWEASNDGTATVTFTSSTGQNDWSQYHSLVAVWYVRSWYSSSYDQLNAHYGQGGSAYNYSVKNQIGLNTGGNSGVFDGPNSIGWHVGYVSAASSTANEFSGGIFEVRNHMHGTHTTVLSQTTGPCSARVSTGVAGNYAGTTSEMDTIVFDLANGNFQQFSRIDLFGILPKMILEGTL
jgi:hypothetical protein